MSVDFFGKVFGSLAVNRTALKAVNSGHGVDTRFKTKSYASIPYERAPQVMDTVPTKGLLAGYSTPEHVWVA